jgi:hypothetical protein
MPLSSVLTGVLVPLLPLWIILDVFFAVAALVALLVVLERRADS